MSQPTEQFCLKPPEATRNLLVIGYGNELRSDDGVGPKVAAAVATWNSASIRAVSCHQLTPELAEVIASAEAVVFVDATLEPLPSVRLESLVPVDAADAMTHATDPGSLLSLGKTVFGQCPPAWTLTIPVVNLGFGGDLSERATNGVQAALAQIRALRAAIV